MFFLNCLTCSLFGLKGSFVGCGAKGTCPEVCTDYPIQNRIRHLNTDVGYYLKFDFDSNGLPYGCSAWEKGKLAKRNVDDWTYMDDLPDSITPAGKVNKL